MNDVEKDQLVDQGSNDILGGISDEKDQMIDSIAEAILNRILDDERIKALTFSKEFDKDSRKNKDHMPRYDAQAKIQNNTNQSILLRDLVPDSNRLLVASIKRYKWAKEYLDIIETLYEEVRIENTNFPFGYDNVPKKMNPIQTVVYHIFNVKNLMRIEVFMLALLYQPTPAFIFFGTSGNRTRRETPLELKKRVTRLGEELLFLWSNKDFIKLFHCDYLTRNTKILADFFNELEPTVGEKTSFTLEQDLTLDSLFSLSNLLLELKSFAESGRYKKNLPPRMLYRKRDGDAESITRIIRPSRIEMTKAWDRRSQQLSDAIVYFQKYKCQSIFLYRVQISLSLVSGSVTADQFLKLFGIFNKKAKKPNGLKGYSDFLYFWKEDFETQDLILDLVCVFKAEALMQQTENDGEQVYKYRNIRLDLQNYFQQVLNEQSEIFEGRKVSLQFEPTPILQNSSYGLTPEFLIELGDKTKWKIFEQKVLPYFIFMEFFDVNYSDEIKNRFKRGQAS